MLPLFLTDRIGTTHHERPDPDTCTRGGEDIVRSMYFGPVGVEKVIDGVARAAIVGQIEITGEDSVRVGAFSMLKSQEPTQPPDAGVGGARESEVGRRIER